LPDSVQAAEKVRMALGPSGFALAPVHLAAALGLFEEVGLDVERIGAPRPGLEIRALEAGQADFAFASGDALLSAPPGRALLVVYSGLQRPIVTWVMRTETARQRGVREGSPLSQRVRALRGLAVGVPAGGGLGELLARSVASREGLKIGEELRLVTVGGGDDWGAALKAGRVDAALHMAPFPEMAVQRGEAVSLINFAAGEDAAFSEFLMGALLVRAETVERHGEKVRQATRALYLAVRWALASPAEKVAETLQPYAGRKDPRETLAGVNAILPALNPHGRATERAFQATVEAVERAGMLRRPVRYEEIVTSRFLPG
jgi:ABC-type nitrate/sulfonate/bicarbonate transport system substrate-binding protein